MTSDVPFPVEPWTLREASLDLNRLAVSESLFALSNGHIGVRANLDEGEPHGITGTYVNSFYETRALPHAEAGYGYPESSQTIVNVTNGKTLRLLVDDSPFDVRDGTLLAHERVLDMRAGVLERHADWISPTGKRVRVGSRRLVSFVQRGVMAVEYEVEAMGRSARVVVQSELVANEMPPPRGEDDPRMSAVLDDPLVPVEHEADGRSALLVHRTRGTGLTLAAAMDHVIAGPDEITVGSESREDWARTTVTCMLHPGQRLRLVKFVAYGWSPLASGPSLRDQVTAALREASLTTFSGLMRHQRAYLDAYWETADVRIEGDDVLQQAVRFGLFQVLQSSARAERRCIPAKGLTGPGYDGHTFWDTEGFVLPLLTHAVPGAAADSLRWRHSTLNLARRRAATLGHQGAAFPWRTIRGQECSGYWPAGTAAFHVNADIADAVVRYVAVTSDLAFEEEVGLELLVETARLWASVGHHDPAGRWHIAGVTGPDEYSAIADDNVFTNLMAARNLRAAAEAVSRHPGRAQGLGVTDEEVRRWRDAAAAVHVPYDSELQVHPQSEGFTRHQEWDFTAYRDRYPLLMNAPYHELYRKQVIKQADLVLAMHWCGDAFTAEQKARNFGYYEARTVRDSSLSACTQAVMAAEVGHLELAHDYAHEAALVDLRDLHHNTKDGLHMASLAGGWTAVVAGFGGMRDHDGVMSFDPALPAGIDRVSFSMGWGQARLDITVERSQVTYAVRGAATDSVPFRHVGADVEVCGGHQVVLPLQARLARPAPSQPVGRAPRRGTAPAEEMRPAA
jgi:trehalose/maltose hydrolase-like predicted phosphorylase